jgi:hypothetical protein
MYRLCLLIVLAGALSGQRQVTPSPTKSKQAKNQRQTAEQKKIQEFLGSRIEYAKLLTAYFANIGRQFIRVTAIDENQQTLDVFSALIGKPFGTESHNLISAREVIQSEGSLAMLKKCRFKKVVIRGTDYAEAYAIVP